MITAKVGSYSVGTMRKANYPVSRFITCLPDVELDGGVEGIVLYFIPEHPRIGFLADGKLTGFLPPEDFGDVYHILQTEQPVYLNWDAREEDGELEYLSVGTRQEPPGEGLHDVSV